MTLPQDIPVILVSGQYLLGDGTAAAGSVSFTPSISAATLGVVLPIAPLAVELNDDGALEVELAATDDPDWVATGWTYTVTERIAGARPRIYSIEVPAASPGGALDLATVVPVVAAGAVTPYVLAAGATMTGPLILSDGSPAASEEYVANNGGGGAAPRFTEPWTRDGEAAEAAGNKFWFNRTGSTRTIHGVWVSAGIPPTGSALVVDVHKNGVTIFTTQANRPSVAAGTNGGVLATPDVTTLADGDYLTVDIDDVGSTVPGSDVTVGVVMS